VLGPAEAGYEAAAGSSILSPSRPCEKEATRGGGIGRSFYIYMFTVTRSESGVLGLAESGYEAAIGSSILSPSRPCKKEANGGG